MPALSAEKSDDKKKEDAELDEVQVTGSRILRKDLESNSPTITLGSEVFDNRSNIAVENALNELPQFVPGLVYSQDINRQEQQGNASSQFGSLARGGFSAANTVGATTVSLRGLGANRNLVLMNGKRLVPVNASMSVDTSSIPSSALQRVEIVTGGASSVYGADAVSGVINFILRDNFEGANLDVQYGLAEVGDNSNLRVSGLLGGNFADGRGNALIGLEYAERGIALNIDRDFYKEDLMNPYKGSGGNSYFSTYVAGTNPQTGCTDPITFANRCNPSAAAVNALFPGYAAGSVPNTSTFLIGPGGVLSVPGDTEGSTRFPSSLIDGLQFKEVLGWQNTAAPGAPANFIRTRQVAENNLITRLSSPLRRYSMFGSAHFDITDSLTFYTQTTFAQTKTESVGLPGNASGAWGILIPHGSGRNCASIGVTGDCSAASFATTPTLAKYQAGGSVGLSCPATGGCTNSQAFPVPTELGTLLDSRGLPAADWVLNLPLRIFGDTRATTNESTNFQIIAGFKGDLPLRDWTYDVYTSAGTSRVSQMVEGATSYGLLRALLRQPNYGRSAQIDGNIAPPGSATAVHPILKCTSGVPVFPSSLSPATVSQDCLNSVLVNPSSTTKMDQNVIEGTVQGGLFELPAGELRFAAGASYRTNKFAFIPADILSPESILDGVVGFNPITSNDNSDNVKDIFTELLVPVLTDLPFAKHLNLELGYRYSDYKYAGSVGTWKALADWAITSDFRLRGGYQKANRAPNLVELFESRDDFKFGPGDPCANNSSLSWSVNPAANGNNATKAAQVRALCAQLMGGLNSPGYTTFYNTTANQTNFLNAIGFSTDSVRISGNQNLKSESSDTWTIGAVLRSPFESPLARFTTSVDYYKIKVSDSIRTVELNSLYGGLYRHCYDPAFNETMDPNDSFCQQIPRDTTTGLKASQVAVQYTNVGGIISEGIDFSFNWSAALADFGIDKIPGRISVGSNTNYTINDGRQSAVEEPFEDFTGLSGFGSFRWSMANSFGWFNGPLNASLRWRHYPSVKSYTRFANIDGRVEGVGAYDIMDMSFGYSVSSKLSLRFGVDNLLDKDPPIDGVNQGRGGPGQPEYNPGNIAGGAYSTTGRSYFAGVRVSF